jgi:hypothetical protein
MSKFKIPTERIRPCFTSHRSTFTSERLTFSSQPLQKDERALPGNLHNRKFIFVLPVKCSVSHYSPSVSLFSPSFVLQRAKERHVVVSSCPSVSHENLWMKWRVVMKPLFVRHASGGHLTFVISNDMPYYQHYGHVNSLVASTLALLNVTSWDSVWQTVIASRTYAFMRIRMLDIDEETNEANWDSRNALFAERSQDTQWRIIVVT